MRVTDVAKFYRATCEKDPITSYINLFNLEHVDGDEDVLLPNRAETLGESVRASSSKYRTDKYVVVAYYVARDCYKKDERCNVVRRARGGGHCDWD